MNDIYGKDYKVGKAFHIYRPKIIDAEGKETWGILKIENGIYSVEILQEFLDKAVYPIKSNDTFGYTTLGASTVDNENYISFESGQPAQNGTGSKITAGVQLDVTGTVKYKANLYTYVTSADVGNQIANGQTVEVGVTRTVKGWEDFIFITSPSVTGGTNYYLALWTAGWAGGAALVASDSGGASEVGWESLTYGTWPSPVTGENTDTLLYSIYCTYTPGGGEYNPSIARRRLLLRL